MEPSTRKAGEPPRKAHHGGFLRALAKDQRGATLALMVAAIIPIAGLIGSGLDISRAYMTKAKLQNACDAAALATRRYMGGSQFSDEAKAEGVKFFNFNFPSGTMSTTPVQLSIRQGTTDLSMVEVSASTRVPTTIMKMFGVTGFDLAVSCSADQDYVHNDIMLVLDVTLSMNCKVGSAAGSYCPSEQTDSRISKLRAAGINLYKALEGANGVRTRYGFMPYSLTTNVGKSINGNYIRKPGRYWKYYCTSWDYRGRCNGSEYRFEEPTRATDWYTNTWAGCVEERSSIGTADVNNNPRITNTVTQADIDTVSTTDESRKWQPYDPVAQEAESGNTGLDSFCPRPATKLTTYGTRDAFDTAFKAGLTNVGGYTFHDIGMMWGMRFLSSSGMFASENPTTLAYNGFPSMRVDKHIIFFTDGELEVNRSTYSAYGVDERDNRMISASGSQQEAKHRAHFLSACDVAQDNLGITVWVIALDVNGVSDIKPCASSNDHFFISDGTNLDQIFTLIGKGIGRLRLTK